MIEQLKTAAPEPVGYDRQPPERIDRLGDFYTSEYAAKNQPWIRDVPFVEWVERQGVQL